MRPGLMRKAMVLVGAFGVAGCSGILNPLRPEVALSYIRSDPLDTPTEVHIAIDGRNVRLPAPDNEESGRTSATITARRYGSVPVHIALLTTDGDTLAALQITHRLERGHGHWVGAQVSDWRPQGHCIGAVATAPLRPPSADTLFVMYGGIPHDAIC